MQRPPSPQLSAAFQAVPSTPPPTDADVFHSIRFAAALDRFRRAFGLTQVQLAKPLGVSQPLVFWWLFGERTPGPERMAALSARLGAFLVRRLADATVRARRESEGLPRVASRVLRADVQREWSGMAEALAGVVLCGSELLISADAWATLLDFPRAWLADVPHLPVEPTAPDAPRCYWGADVGLTLEAARHGRSYRRYLGETDVHTMRDVLTLPARSAGTTPYTASVADQRLTDEALAAWRSIETHVLGVPMLRAERDAHRDRAERERHDTAISHARREVIDALRAMKLGE